MIIAAQIKEVRKNNKLSQATFGERLGVSRDVINNLENGRVDVSEIMIKVICKEFNVNEEWLRTGAGEMFVKDDNSLIAALSNKYNLDDLGRKIIETYIKLPENQRLALNGFIQNLVDNLQDTNVVKAKRPESSIFNVGGKAMLQPIAARSKDDRAAAAREIDDDFLEKFRKAKPITSDDEI